MTAIQRGCSVLKQNKNKAITLFVWRKVQGGEKKYEKAVQLVKVRKKIQ